jgi:peptidoglycan/LPS O-acetylase OafA/YrhL
VQKDKAADGLRGLAALCVVLYHYLFAIYPLGFQYAYPGLAGPDATPSRMASLLATPLVSVLYSGNFAVCIFFVLSGYVLAMPFIQRGDLSSLKLRAARRYVRLGVPIFGSIMLAYVLSTAGAGHADKLAAISHNIQLQKFWNPAPSFADALKQAFYQAMIEGDSSLVPLLWTMRIEFLGSMLVFAYWALNPRGFAGFILLCATCLMVIVLTPLHWMLFLGFLLGSYFNYIKAPQPKPLMLAALVLAIVFGSFDNSGLYSFANFIPLDFYTKKHLVNMIGALFLMYAVRGGMLDGLLLSRPAQFLGKISYSIYLTHFTILLTFSAWLFVWLRSHTHLAYAAAAAIYLLASLALIVIASRAFAATFDRYGIRLSKWIIRSPMEEPEARTDSHQSAATNLEKEAAAS